MNTIDIGRAFKAPFADEKWVNKTLLGFLWILLVVTSPAAIGAMIEYIKGVAEGREDLPEWDDFGGKWVKGFMAAIAGFIYMLPVAIVGAIFAVPVLIAAAASGDSSGGALGGLMAGGMCLFWVIAIVYIVAVSIFFYGALANYAMKGTFGAFFEVGAIMEKVRGNNGYWTAWLYALLVSFGASAISSALSATGIGSILYPAVAYLAYMITGHIFGQWVANAYGIAPAAAPAAYTPPAYAPPPPPAPPAYAPPAPPAPPAPVVPVAPEAPVAPIAPEPAAPPAYEPPTPPAPPAPEPFASVAPEPAAAPEPVAEAEPAPTPEEPPASDEAPPA